MGRHSTSDIKQRKRTTVYLTTDLANKVDIAYFNALSKLSRRIDKTMFFDALLEAGLNHEKEIRQMLIER